MADANGQSIKFTTPFGTVVAHGFNVVVALSIAALTWVVMDQNQRILEEHRRTQCLVQLSVWVYTQPRGATPSVIDVPTELWQCVPKFMTREK